MITVFICTSLLLLALDLFVIDLNIMTYTGAGIAWILLFISEKKFKHLITKVRASIGILLLIVVMLTTMYCLNLSIFPETLKWVFIGAFSTVGMYLSQSLFQSRKAV